MITDKVTTGDPYFVELEHHQPAAIKESLSRDIFEGVDAALNCLEIQNGASHSELILKPDGTKFFVEIGSRMGGDCIGSDLVGLSTGYDFLNGVIEIAMGEFSGVKKTKSQCAGICYVRQQPGTITKIVDNTRLYPEIVKKSISAEKGDIIGPIMESADRVGYYIYAGKKRFKPPEPVIKIVVAP